MISKESSLKLGLVGKVPGDQFSLAPGSLAYLAPEVLLGKGKSQAADIWSLGVLLYELIHKVPPYG